MALLLGIDIGTSSAKAVLFNADTGQLVAVAGREYPIHTPTPDAAEQDPDDWWQAVIEVVQRVTTLADRRDIAAIGFSGQMHGVVLLDTAGAPLHPAIIWADQRSAAASADLIARVSVERFTALAGTLPAAGFMGPTLRWLSRHRPVLLDQASKVVLPKDYVRLKLVGEIATDISDAAATALFNISQRSWSAELIEAAELTESLFPSVLESAQVAGTLRKDAAAALGLRPGIPVVTGCADQPAQAIACGLIVPGAASVTTGTGGQVFVPLAPPSTGPVPTDTRLHVFNHAVPDLWYVLGAILSAGLALRWLRRITGLEKQPDAYSLLSAEAAAVPPGANGLAFLPYLLGERTPHMDPLARGCFIGLSYSHERGHLARAVMEGVAFALRQALEISQELTGPLNTLIGSGGGIESSVWRQIQTDVFGLALRKSLLTEQAGVGAALLAGVGAGVYQDLKDACAHCVQLDQPTEPDPKRHRLYSDLYNQYCQLYPLLRSTFHWHANRVIESDSTN